MKTAVIIQVHFACNVILNVLTVIIVSNIMGSVFERTKVGPDVNPSCLGRFSNIFINYASSLCLQCNTHANE
jgi:hypothetical protein